MTDSYRGGYKKALLDIMEFLSNNTGLDWYCKSKNQYKNASVSFLKVLLTSPNDLDSFMDGTYKFKFNVEEKVFLPNGR